MREINIEKNQKFNESEDILENNYERIIQKGFELISTKADERTGLFPAANPDIQTPESKENHMQEAWIRDTSWNIILLIETMDNLERAKSKNQITRSINEFLNNDILKILNLLNQPRWLDKFNQTILDNGSHTALSGEAPEVHLKQDGQECHWDQNQPESWGELLIAIGKAKEKGILVECPSELINVIRIITEYLIRIKPWKFSGAGMWEGLPAYSPASRSSAIAIAKGLEAISIFFKNDPRLIKQIDDTVDKTINFVKEDVNHDYTTPDSHPDGADLAMLAAIILPGSNKTELSFTQYIEDNGQKLQIGPLPGTIRFIGDLYNRGELGEARWFMADPIMAIGYFKEASRAYENGNLEMAEKYKQIAQSRLDQSLRISKHYDRHPQLFPELFIQRDPDNVHDEPNILIMNDGTKTVALQPLERSLLWNTCLVMAASAESVNINKIGSQKLLSKFKQVA